MKSSVEIIEVKNNKDLKKFIQFPDKLYKNNPYRAPQLHSFEKKHLDKKSNPAFEYCEAKYWLAYKNGKIVGRIAAILNHKSNEIWKEKNMRFGWIDFIDDLEVSKKLIDTVEKWAIEKGMNAVHGPLGFTDFDLEGMLVEGFDEMGTQAVIYNYPYYPQHMENLGYKKDTDWVQLEVTIPKDKVPEKITRISKLVQKKYELKLVDAKKTKDILKYADQIFDLINESYVDLYGFVPFNEKQKKYYKEQYFSMVDPKFVNLVVDKNDQLVGFGLASRSLTKALIKAKGKLFPIGFVYILWALKTEKTLDLLLHAVKPQYFNKGVPAIFYESMTQNSINAGITKAITSHILEDNKPSLQMFNPYKTRQHLRRRIYIKDNIKK